MIYNKRKAFLERYNYLPKDINYKNIKLTHSSDEVIPKVKPNTIPEAIVSPGKHISNSKEYNIPNKFDNYFKFGPEYPTWNPSYPKQKYKIKSLASGDSVTDTQGLNSAYGAEHNIYTNGDTLYIAGTQAGKLVSGSLPWNWGSGNFSKGAEDVWDDVSKIPFYGDLKNSTRYKEAETALKANPNIKRVVGDSLGGSVALELQKQYPQLESRTYGAPIWDPNGEDTQKQLKQIDIETIYIL